MYIDGLVLDHEPGNADLRMGKRCYVLAFSLDSLTAVSKYPIANYDT